MSTQQSPAGGGSGQTPTRLGSLLNGPTSSPGDRLGALRPAAGLSVSAHGIAGVGSRLGPAMASLGVDTAAAVAGGAHAHASARQNFAPRVPAERPRNRVASGQPVSGGAPTSVAPQFAALLERTQLDSARLDARLAGHRSPVSAPASTGVQHRAKSAQGAGAPDAVPQKRPSAAARPPAHTASRQPRGGVKDDHAAAGPAPASARAVDVALPAPAGEAPSKRQARRPGAKDRGGLSGPPAPRARAAAATAGLHPIGSDSEDSSNDGLDDVMDVDDDGAAAAGGMPSWADPAREYPITLPFPEPEAVDLADMAERQDGQLFLMQLPALLPMANAAAPGTPVGLESLNDGVLGQLLIYKSGAVKLRCSGSDVLFDVLPGAPLAHCEQLAAVNPAQGRVAFLGTARARFAISPDVDALLTSTSIGDMVT